MISLKKRLTYYTFDLIINLHRKDGMPFLRSVITRNCDCALFFLQYVVAKHRRIIPKLLEQFFTALKFLKKETVFVRFLNENHELSRSGQPNHTGSGWSICAGGLRGGWGRRGTGAWCWGWHIMRSKNATHLVINCYSQLKQAIKCLDCLTERCLV